MEIVIKIPDNWFDDMVKEKFTKVDELCAVIQHSKVLPTGHGDLIDCDVAYDEFDKAGCSWEGKLLRFVDVVIPADNEVN